MRIPLLLFVLAGTLASSAQTDDPRLYKPMQASPAATTLNRAVPDTPAVAVPAGTVTVQESDRIERLMKDYAGHKQELKGYRVQIFLGDRTKAEDIRRSFLVRNAATPAYLSYLAPNFRVRVGDLRSRLEAEKMRQDLSGDYPGLYVVPDAIELPRLDGTP